MSEIFNMIMNPDWWKILKSVPRHLEKQKDHNLIDVQTILHSYSPIIFKSFHIVSEIKACMFLSLSFKLCSVHTER